MIDDWHLRNRVGCDFVSGVPQFLNMLVVVVFVTDVERGMDGAAVGIFTVKNEPSNPILRYNGVTELTAREWKVCWDINPNSRR